MKILLATITWVLLFLSFFENKCKATSDINFVDETLNTTDSQQARQTVLDFLTWYKKNISAINRFPLVNQKGEEPYSVNLKNGERYLGYLKKSNLLTDKYLDNWRQYFKERNEGFRQNPENEGPPTGFEYDLVLLSQDVDMQLNSLSSLKINKITVLNNSAKVNFKLIEEYQFELLRRNNRWMINNILNLSQE